MATATKSKHAPASSGLTATSPRKDLFEGVAMVSKAVATRSSLPILTHVLMRQDESTGRLSVTATDLEMWIEHTLPLPQEQQIVISGGAATAPARNLADLLAAMPEANVEITSEGGDGAGFALHLRCNRANYKLLGLSPEEFPLLPQVKEDTQFHVGRQPLREAIRQTLFAVSSDEARAILTGILLVYKDTTLRLVATDTHRLAVRDCEAIGGSGSEAQVVVPARAMQELLRIITQGSDEGDIAVTLSDNQVQFKVEEKSGAGTTLISRLIEGQFPSYERVIPQAADRVLTLECDPLLCAVKRAVIVARESANRIVLRTVESEDGERLTITAESGNLGNAFEEVEVAREGSDTPVEIAFNAKYLIDVLSVLDTEGLKIELTEPLRPGVVRPVGDPNYFCVLMPMQVV